ncbi:MAG TPA: branched-chain amino acid ABC transporter permease [Burkholderiaceae bacterium]|nr:branched-chain amino acid ABC transporter permease [Burkholderiaceae bacterium]
MNVRAGRGLFVGALALGALVLLALAPRYANSYVVALLINLLLYAVLATAWSLFSGTTRYVSLATVSFFGVGCYTVAVLAERLPWLVVLAVAAALGAGLALLVGLATLRLSGIVFVIFTFGLSELVRQLVTWYEAKIAGSVGRYVFLDLTPAAIYWQLLALAVAVLLLGAWVARSRLGFALRLIGEDEAAARHCGVDATRAKLVMFTASSVFMVLAGAIVAPRWTYIDAAIAFNPLVSFQVVIMALLGGAARFYAPLLGVLPVVLLFEVFVKYFPNHFSIVLGLAFLLIVYLLPQGVVGLVVRRKRQ